MVDVTQTTPVAGQASTVTLDFKLNSGQVLPVKFLAPCGPPGKDGSDSTSLTDAQPTTILGITLDDVQDDFYSSEMNRLVVSMQRNLEYARTQQDRARLKQKLYLTGNTAIGSLL